MLIQLHLKSLDKKTLNLYLTFLENLFKKTNIKFNIQRLPTKKRIISLLKSPHVNKKAIEQFQLLITKAVVSIKSKQILKIAKYFIINKPKCVILKFKQV
jgi:ribosomal protein S10